MRVGNEEQTMNSQRCYRINRPNVVFETFDDEIVIINLDSCNYYSLDRIGANIWGLIDSGAAVSEIVEWVTNRYEGSSLNDIENAVNQSIAELEKEDLIVPDKVKKNENRKELGIEVKTESGTEKYIFEKPVLQKYTDMQHFLSVDLIREVDCTDWPHK